MLSSKVLNLKQNRDRFHPTARGLESVACIANSMMDGTA